MDLSTLRTNVVGDYNTRNSTKVSLMDKYDFLCNYKSDEELTITNWYISDTEKVIHSAFWALTEKNYHKCLAFLNEYKKRIRHIESELNKFSNYKNEVTILEEKIEFNEVKNNTWTRMSQFIGFSNNSGFIALKNRINVYNNTIKNSGKISYRINYLYALTKDIEHFWKTVKQSFNKKVNNEDEGYAVAGKDSIETPDINFSTKHKYFSIKGRSNPTNYYGFWSPIADWVTKQFESGVIDSSYTLEINLSYLCPRSSSYILRILKIFNTVGANVNWFHKKDDTIILDDINNFKHFIPTLNLNKIELDA